MTTKLEGRKLIDWLNEIDGNWRHLPSPDGFFLLKRLDSPEFRNANGRLALCGELAHQGEVTDYQNLIGTSRWTGQLHVVFKENQRILSFTEGDLTEAKSNAPEHRLGELAVRFGTITRKSLQEALRKKGDRHRIGRYLVKQNLISSHDLYELLQKQAEEIFYCLLLVSHGQFFFFRQDSQRAPRTPFRLSTQSLLMTGVQRIDEMSYFRQKIPSSDVIFELSWPDGGTPALESTELAILELIDGERTLDEIATTSRMGGFETTKIAFQLLQSGVIRSKVSDGLGGKGYKAKKEGLLEVASLFNDIFARLLREAELQDRAQELVVAVGSFFKANNDYRELFRGVQYYADGTLDCEALCKNASESDAPDKVEFLYQGLNEFLFFQTFIAGETLDAETEEKLHERLSAIMDGNDDHLAPESDSTNSTPPLSIF